MVSIATVVYNGARDIARTLESALGQSYTNFEIVVVDGASSDGTQDIVRRFGSQIQSFVSEPDSGVYDAMNKALRLARGEFIVFMNCGDLFASPNALELAMNAVAAGSESVVFGAWIRNEPGQAPAVRQPSLEKGLFNHQAILYSRSIHAWHGQYVEVPGLTTADYLFFATLIASGKATMTTIAEPLATVTVDGISSGLQTYAQKCAVDFVCGRIDRAELALSLLLHPAYVGTKRWLRMLR